MHREDQFRLNVAAEIRGALSGIGMWPTDAELIRYATERAQIGRTAVLNCLPVLGPKDWTAMMIDEIDVTNLGSRRAIASMGAFGWSFATAMQMLVDTETRERRRAQACAMFNIGISLLDRVADGSEAGRAHLFDVLDRTTVTTLSQCRSAPAALGQRADCEADPTLRMLLKIVAALYEELHQLAEVQPKGAVEVMEKLVAAYDAEVATHSRQDTGEASVARYRAALPFQVMASINMLASGDVDVLERRAAEEVAAAVGETFGLVDDLVDLPEDCRVGHPNVVVARVARASELHDGQDMLDRVAASGAVEASVSELASRMGTVRSLAARAGGGGVPLVRFVTMYVGAWTKPLTS